MSEQAILERYRRLTPGQRIALRGIIESMTSEDLWPIPEFVPTFCVYAPTLAALDGSAKFVVALGGRIRRGEIARGVFGGRVHEAALRNGLPSYNWLGGEESGG